MEQLSVADLEKLPHNFQVRFAIFCAKQEIDIIQPDDKQVCENVILIAERWLQNKATIKECKIAKEELNTELNEIANTFDVANAILAVICALACVTYKLHTAHAAEQTAMHAVKASINKQQTIKEQQDYYDELLAITEPI